MRALVPLVLVAAVCLLYLGMAGGLRLGGGLDFPPEFAPESLPAFAAVPGGLPLCYAPVAVAALGPLPAPEGRVVTVSGAAPDGPGGLNTGPDGGPVERGDVQYGTKGGGR